MTLFFTISIFFPYVTPLTKNLKPHAYNFLHVITCALMIELTQLKAHYQMASHNELQNLQICPR